MINPSTVMQICDAIDDAGRMIGSIAVALLIATVVIVTGALFPGTGDPRRRPCDHPPLRLWKTLTSGKLFINWGKCSYGFTPMRVSILPSRKCTPEKSFSFGAGHSTR